MIKKQNQDGRVIKKKSGAVQAIDLIFGLGSALIIGSILFFIFHRIIYGLQRLLYQRSGEVLIGSSNIVIGIFALVGGLVFFIVDFLCKLAGKYFPKFYSKYYFNANGELQINEKAFRKFKIALVGTFIFGMCFAYVFFHEYITLGDNYIAASALSMFHNRKQYGYSDIKIWKKLRRDSKYDWLYTYEFPDGKKIANLGSSLGGNDMELIKMIQAKQRNLGLSISSAYLGKPTKEPGAPIRFISYLIWASTFFFIPWLLRNLFKRKN